MLEVVPDAIPISRLEKVSPGKVTLEWVHKWVGETRIHIHASTQRTKDQFNSSWSEQKNTSSGVLQGCVLDPVLFIICISNLDDRTQSTYNIYQWHGRKHFEGQH